MNQYSLVKQRLLTTAFVFAGSLAFPSLVGAQEVNLRSPDGTFDISGELLDYVDNTYVIETTYGELRVEDGRVECIGEACPTLTSEQTGPIVWDVSLWGKPRAFTEHVEKLAELVDEASGGDFTLELHYGDLSPVLENLDGIAAGDFEIAQFCAGYHPEKNPTLTVLELPFLGVSSLEMEVAVSDAVYAHPATQADMDRWNATLLMPTPQPQQNLVGVGQPPLSLADFANMSIRAQGGVAKAVEAMGADALNLPAPQVQEAMESGQINAASFSPHAHMSFGTIDQGTWWTTNLDPGTAHCPIVVNSTALERLPDVHRVALLSSVDAALDHYIDNYNGATMDAWGPALVERGIIELTISDSILTAIDEVVATPVAERWVTEQTALGLPGQELYDIVIGTVGGENGS